jgi:prepilin-type N-terminal cleavage/methylation domain-containing protein
MRTPRHHHLQGGLTVVEVMIVLAITAIVALAGISLFSDTSMQPVIIPRYTSAPATISLSRGATGTFVYTITQHTGAAPASALPARATSFSVSPSPGASILSVTNGAGHTLAVGGATTTTSTDVGGNVTIVVRMDVLANGTLVATDAQTGRAQTAYFTAVQ